MAIDTRKHMVKHRTLIRDTRPMYVRLAQWALVPSNSAILFGFGACAIYFMPAVRGITDVVVLIYLMLFWWLASRDRKIAFKMPMGSKWDDSNNKGPGRSGKAEGILYLGNVRDTKEEVWFTNSDARTHILYLGTTGAGKTEGLKSMVANALAWGSGFVYIDGKADTDLWSSLSSLVRRFGRDDDLLVLNYMTGNSDTRAPSNTMNPFSSGSASYLTNMLVSLMPNAEGDNAMWKERAVSLISSLMPVMTWKRDHQEMPMSVTTIRQHLNLDRIVRLSRDEAVPEKLRASLKGYLDTLPGYVEAAFDDEGREKPPGPDHPPIDTTTVRQQHGYLSMQFTRSLQSLGDDYGYIFDTQAADVDMVDVVLNRRVLVVLIPALEKSGDEIANLGKIVAATIKGMMGSTLGATVEGSSSTVIENKPTHSSTPFMTVFDEVGYYTAEGMAVMAAQARSLGFCLVFSGQDLPAMKKRVKEEANSIVANCNIKIFGKLEDPTETKDFFEKTVGTVFVTEVQSFQMSGGGSTGSYLDTKTAGIQNRARATYDDLRSYKEGEAIITFGEEMMECNMFYSNPGHAKAMRVTRFMSLPPPDDHTLKYAATITKVRDLLVNKSWTARKTDVAAQVPPEIDAMKNAYATARDAGASAIDRGISAIIGVFALFNPLEEEGSGSAAADSSAPPAPAAAQQAPAAPVSPLAAIRPGVKDAPPAEKSAPPPAPPTEAAGGGPMSFFGKKPQTQDQAPAAAEAPKPAPAPQTSDTPASSAPGPKKPISWEQLMSEASQEDETSPVQAPVASSPAPSVQQSAPGGLLPHEAEDIIREAAGDLRAKLFRKDKAGTDAAE